MVTVPYTSVDRTKFITEHDVLKLVGAVASALLVPLVVWMFISTHNAMVNLRTGLAEVHEQVAVLKSNQEKLQAFAITQFNASRSQEAVTGAAIQGLREDAGNLIKAVNSKAVKSAKRR